MTTVLIVEDNSISARILEVNLKKAGYETVVTRTGKEALQALEAAPTIALIISDVIMGDMDGFRLLKDLKASECWKDIPVIMCTSLGNPEHVKRAGTLGCRYYLVKPIQPGLLLRKVAEALSSEKPTLKDMSEVLVQFGLDEGAYRDVAGTFKRLVKDEISVLERLDKNHAAPLRPSLRSLSEGASVLGAERLSECVGRLLAATEGSLSMGGWLPGYRQLLTELELVDQALAPIPTQA